jgi:chromosome transmission fidelity protein 4
VVERKCQRIVLTILVNLKAHSLVTGSTDGVVRRFEYPSNQLSGTITRAAGVPIHWLSVDNSGQRVAVCSEELLVKVVDIQDPLQILTISGISKPVRSASWHPVQDMLTLVMTDGRIQVYEFVDDSPSCLKTVEGVAGAGKLEDELPCAVAWHPKGDYFVVPSRTHEIAIVDRDKWSKTGTFSTDGHDAEIGLLAWSPNGKYLASSAKDNQIIIWDADTRKPVARTKTDGKIVTGLEFSPNDNALAFTTTGGNFYAWQDVVPSNHPHPAKAPKTGLEMLGDDDDVDGDDANDGDNFDLDDDDGWIEHDEDEDVGPDGLTKYRVRGESVDPGGVKEIGTFRQAVCRNVLAHMMCLQWASKRLNPRSNRDPPRSITSGDISVRGRARNGSQKQSLIY